MPTDIFENTDDASEIITYFDEYGESPFVEFLREFSPDTEEWEAFNEAYEEIWGYPIEDTSDDEDDEEEDVNDWDTEPQYPLDEIDSLEIRGSTFVLTGEFQNCDGERAQVQERIEAKGGRCTGAVSGKTNYLVLGDFGDIGAKKIENVMEQRAKGKDIKIIAEYDLFRFCKRRGGTSNESMKEF